MEAGNTYTTAAARAAICGPEVAGMEQVLTEQARDFLVQLNDTFGPARLACLAARQVVQAQIDNGQMPGFAAETAHIRNTEWKVDPAPRDLTDRRVEITGPVDAKMIINALNSGAHVFMADFEDSNTPTWENNITGQLNLSAAIRRTLNFQAGGSEKVYSLNNKVATLMVRPRGWHLEEKHFLVDGRPTSASLFDFGLYFLHNAAALLERNSAPYFYLPKIEHHLEARLWNSVFNFAEDYLQVPRGTIKATVLIETIPAAFQMNEILWELRTHSAGLNCGRWDYIFSFIKKMKNVPGYVFPERSQVTMTVPCMRAYTQLVIQTCHKRGIHAIGGMAAQIPIKGNDEANTAALAKVRTDKLREVLDGHDGTWVAHPALVPVALDVFDKHMTSPNQLDHLREDLSVTEADLLQLPAGTITEAGLRLNINIGILYIESWLRGFGAAAIYNMMEDAATAEISRTQVWQWIKAAAVLDDGRPVTRAMVHTFIELETEKIKAFAGADRFANGRFGDAIALFNDLVFADTCADFLTTSAYTQID